VVFAAGSTAVDSLLVAHPPPRLPKEAGM